MSIMLPPDSDGNNRDRRGWRANDLTPADVAPLLDRFRQCFTPGSPDECWLWHGYRMNNSYGGVPRSGRRGPLLAHRVAWVAATGESLHSQLTIDHLCNVRLCVNPAHLEPVSLAENQRRKRERNGWIPDAEKSTRVACTKCGVVTRRDHMRRHDARKHAGVLLGGAA